MNSSSPMYQLILLLVCFGGLSVMIAFVGLLPGVGTWLSAVFGLTIAENTMKRRKNESVWENEP